MERHDSGLLEASLPDELLQIIQDHSSSNTLYLQTLTKTALDARYTYILLAHCGDLFAHICASLREHASLAASIATLGRVLPHGSSFLSPFATGLLEREIHKLGESEEEDLLYLLGLFRLLRADHRIYRKYVQADQLAALLDSSSRPVTYLILRILQIHLSAADHWFESAVKRYLGPDSDVGGAIDGPWDEKLIDYRFLSLWEEDRHSAVSKLIEETRSPADHFSGPTRMIPANEFHPTTSLIGGVLLPRSGPSSASTLDKLVATKIVTSNMERVAQALKSPSPLLLTGLPGAGKTMLIRSAAQSLGKLDKMVTLHLNEQSDAKLLLGIYTTGDTPGSFVWRAGVLTTAVQEGRWVLIEDLDRAPNEVLGTLLPLIERRELQLSNRKDTIHAADGFRILATVRSTVNHRGEESKPLTHMLGFRHWQTVSIEMPSSDEHGLIAKSLCPNLEPFLPQFMTLYERLMATRQQSAGQSKTGVARPISPRDLLKWCQRVSLLLKNRTSFSAGDYDSIYLEAIDCFVGALPDDATRANLSAVMAEELRIDPQRREYLLHGHEVKYQADKSKIVIGRYSLAKSRQVKTQDGSFSTNPHTTRMLERVTAAVLNREPLLLVGETGVGKTTAVQHLATNLGKKLVPFNLSQQSEAGDLLGGFKPVNARTLMVPLKDEFDDLFAQSFSSAKNLSFTQSLGKAMAKGKWKTVCHLFNGALGMVEQQRASSPTREGEAPSKKRKVDSKYVIDFARWDEFAAQLRILERKLGSGSDAIAFTFVEGNIVKAVRNGDWVLLDEINLASSDTLEAIADLLEPAPSLLLTEAGNIERITANPDFRVFAAMNPATDVGKKDLPPGIRSRFTELYVESPDRDLKSLQSIVRAYLRQEATADAAVAVDVSKLYMDILDLARENKLVDGAGQRPHFSLRTLTRTLSFARTIQQSCSLRRALYEGFQMSFLTFLDIESARLIQPMIEKALFKKTNVKSELQKSLAQPNDEHSYVKGYPKSNEFPESKHWIRQGPIELQDQPEYIITSFVRSNLENLVRAASTRQFPVLIQGPTSSGKTSMIEYLAKRTGHKFTRINNHEHTDLQEYLGTYISDSSGRLAFQEGVLVKALREGHWIVLDELNLAPTDVLEALNRLLDDNRELLIPETQEVIRPHPDFMLFATQNPAGLYGGRKTLSRAFRNRFLELHFDDIPVDELQTILHRRTQLPESRARRIVAVYKELSILRQENRLFEQKSFATLRDLFRWAGRPNDTIEQLAANGYMLLCERVRKPEERIALKAVIERVMSNKGPKVQIDEDALYAEDCPEIMQHQQRSTAHGVVWTKAMRRLYVLVSRAIANNEPVLLVGETGCGKTTVCQMLAVALEKELHTVNAHQNTETGDLIGSQRPVRNRAGVEARLREQLLASSVMESQHDQSTDELLAAYDKGLAALEKEQKTTYTRSPAHTEIQESRTRFKALFEWADGSLVQAMRDGAFFLLDEISLADDSVLERINSVLESARTILLAEKGSLDSSITAASGFQFFATMNPGGDYGKRELSPALRNRFTEVWVPSLSDTEDILQIVRAKLSADTARAYAGAMVDFASWFKARFDTSASASVSIRDTLAWVEFVNAFQQANLEASVVHGAAMVYIDTLGANPAGLMSLTSNNLEEEREACLRQLGKLVSLDAHAIYGQTFSVNTSGSAFGIGPFTVPRVPGSAPTEQGFTFEPPTTRTNSMRVLRALQLIKPIMLEGSPGVGKTALITAIASAVGMPLTRINLSDQTDLLDLFGSDAPVEGAATGTFVWRDAPFLRAMKAGEWVLLDEMNLASQSVLEGLNACLDHRGEVFVPELGQSFPRHPNFRLFAAQNPHHQGGGRKGLPASFVNRFTVVYADSFQAEDLMMICARMFPSVERQYIQQAVDFVSKLQYEVAERRSFGASGGPWEFNLRDTARWLNLAASKETLLPAGTPQDFVETLFTQRFRTAYDRDRVAELFSSVFSEAAPMSDLFTNVSSQTLQVGIGLLPRSPLISATRQLPSNISSSHLRALQSLMLCVHQAWPVVLAGSPGTGKTTLIERLAASVGAETVTLAMSAETDALDLIGGYEQYDPHRLSAQALSELRSRGDYLAKLALVENSASISADLLRAFQAVVQEPGNDTNLSTLAQLLPSNLHSEILPSLEVLRGNAQSIDKARFEWIDGPLIDALQQGKWLILDNANLCSPSVLDRLNSLLEPNGTLIINEHSTPDGQARVIRPHQGFRIFLTVDPRLGELSRAMRNRAVEVHLTTPLLAADVSASSTDGLYTDSALARFRALRTVDTDDDHALRIAGDHLAAVDQPLVPRFQRELQNGLFQGRLTHSASLLAQHDLTHVMTLYKEASSHLQAPADYACVQVSFYHPARDSVSVHVANGKHFFAQTLHPLNNQPLVANHSQQNYSQALVLAAQFDLAVSLNSIGNAVAAAKNNRKLTERLKRFMRSARAEAGDKGRSELMDILERMLLPLLQWTRQKDVPASELSQARKAMNNLLSLCWVLLRSSESDVLDRALLATCALVAQSIYARCLADAPALSTTLEQFDLALSDLKLTSNGENGQACVSLWKSLKPDMPATMESLDAILKFESVVEQFDQAVSFRFPVSHIVDLRLAFQRSLDVARSSEADLDALTERALAFIPQQIPDEEGELVVSLTPHFATTFEQLCRHFAIFALGKPLLEPIESTTLEVLALRNTVDGVNRYTGQASTATGQLRILGLGSELTAKDSVTDTSLTVNLLRSIANVDQVSLHSLDLLESETKALGRTLASKAHIIESEQLPALDVCLRSLVESVLESISTDDSALKEDASQLQALLAGQSCSITTSSRLLSVVQYLCGAATESTSAKQASSAWQTFAVTCFELYIPDHSFDPVQEAQIQVAVYAQAKGDLESRLSALRNFRHAWSGENGSVRARMLEEDVSALGSGPAIVQICRPQTSQIVQLHTEFQALMRIVKPLRQGTGTLDQNAWSNLGVIRARLVDRYRAYADLAMPVVGFIDCLFVSKRLALLAVDEDATKGTQSLASLTPLMSASLRDWLSDDCFIEVQQACRSKEDQVYWLSVMAVRSTIKPTTDISADLRAVVNVALRQFYEAWRTELSRDQKLDAANSSLYRYRGGDDDEEETTAEELNELFPDYEGEKQQQSKASAASGAQALASKMAELYHAVHNPEKGVDQEQFTQLLHQATCTPSTVSDTKTTGLLCALHSVSTDLSPATASRTANIYLESNIGQCKALVRLIGKVQARFEFIHNAWPEHASPIEVLRASQNVLALSHAEPLASFLPPVEKLHAAIAEWQKFASSEYSASGLLEDITNTVVGWRQLELSTWAGLFEHEDKQCKKSAASWWYIAYETIIRASDETSRSTDSLAKFAQDLVETLGGFLANCGLGEYSIRLRMLADFEADLATRVMDNPMLAPVREALSSLISFYSHFEQAVSEKLATRRAALEKEVKEVIQLASWKDRNIEKLKTSAKSSHKKLFKTVRKYRRLLSEPVASLLQADFPKIATGDIEYRMPVVQIDDKPSFNLTSKAWISRPSTLVDLTATVRRIEASVQGKTSTAAKKITKFLAQLDEESNELRKSTPTTATEANKSLVQHLKTRKRRLLADVLRDVRLMGFQTNIGDDVLASQQSLHVVLARAPPLAVLGGDIVGASLADRDFHRLLHIMPSVRESTVKHSEDLTPAEIARAKILLESMLQVSTGQHTALNGQLKDLASLKMTLTELTAISSSEGVAIRRNTSETVSAFKVKTSTVCAVIQACIQCVKIQSELSGTQYPQMMERLARWYSELVAVNSELLSQASLPQSVDNSAIRSLETAYASTAQQIAVEIGDQIQLYPELGPTLSQLTHWTATHADGVAQNIDGASITADEWAQSLVGIVDRAHGHAVQSSPTPAIPNGDANKQWFLEQQKTLFAASESTSTGTISKDLRALLSQLHRISESSDLAEISLMIRTLQPVLQAYANAAEKLVADMCTLHATTSKMAHRLAVSFIQLARQGFCTPSDKPPSDEQQTGQVESGTGLGDGDGAEDISKDIKDDEDLSELAQDAKKEKDDGEELQDEKDAVDMADEDLEGEFGEENGSEGEEDDQEGQSDAEVDEEAGHVDDKNDDAVDEKTWDDGKAEENADKEADKSKGTRNEDIAAAENAEAAAEEAGDEAPEDGQEQEAGAEDEPDVEHNQPETADPHMEDEQNLDLPEDINMDGDKDIPDDVSDGGSDFGDNLSDVDGKEDAGKEEDADVDMKEEEEAGAEQEDTGEATAAEENQPEEQQDDDAGSDVAMLDRPEEKDEPQQDDALTSADAGQGNEDDESAQRQGTLSAAEQLENENDDQQQPSTQSGAADGSNKSQQDASSGKAEPGQEPQNLPFKQLGDVLKQFYDQHKTIEAAQEPEPAGADPDAKDQMDMDMTDARFEHLPENADSEMQALGAAAMDQSKALDEQNAMPIEETEPEHDSAPPLEQEDVPQSPKDDPEERDETAAGAPNDNGADPGPKPEKAVVGKPTEVDMDLEMDEAAEDRNDELEDVDEQLTNTHLSQNSQGLISIEEARQAWAEHESRTRNMAIVLTEHLRLILQPTQATRMRGDFRTGKRLNIKKIIPYIASSYKRDKIWMRRSIPSKRSYQIMLAIDNSQSMNENERKGLAFDTLALVAKSMSMLEVGELCIVGFGETVNVNHDFDMPFTTDAGAEVYRQFSFTQSRTDVEKLLQKSIELFRTARLKATGSASNLWQLQLIISDGLCEDHPSVRQLVRQAHEEQIMVVFIVVDSTAEESGIGAKQSIIDLPVARFDKDANGETQVHMGKYLDTFPFRYYLIVRDVLELPSVLAGALRQWFAEVVETGG